MRSTTPTLHCDGEDGFCGTMSIDYYETGASVADGVRLTATTRAPGWTSTDDTDLCPECSAGESR